MTTTELLAYLETQELFATIPAPDAREAAALVRRLVAIAKIVPEHELPRLPTVTGQ